MSAPVGMLNAGNTCFINSVLQCLVQLPGIKSRKMSTDTGNLLDNTIAELRSKISNAGDQQCAINISEIILDLMRKTYNCRAGQQGQNDPEEFFQKCMDARGYTESLFCFRINETEKCSKCGENVSDIRTVPTNYVKILKYSDSCRATTIRELFMENIRGSVIDGLQALAHKTRCGEVCASNEGVYTFEYFKGELPSILCLTISSMVSFSRQYKIQKKEKRFFKPEIIMELPEFSSTNKMCFVNYKLHGTVVHIGRGSLHGHYIAYVLQQETNIWYQMVRFCVTHCGAQPPTTLKVPGGVVGGSPGGRAGLVYKLLICFVFVQDDGANAVAVSAEHVQSRNTDEDIYMLFYVRHNNISNSI